MTYGSNVSLVIAFFGGSLLGLSGGGIGCLGKCEEVLPPATGNYLITEAFDPSYVGGRVEVLLDLSSPQSYLLLIRSESGEEVQYAW
jgi:hypothetical protein